MPSLLGTHNSPLGAAMGDADATATKSTNDAAAARELATEEGTATASRVC